jgi:hypothetical protein
MKWAGHQHCKRHWKRQTSWNGKANAGNISDPAIIQELSGEGVGDIEGIEGVYKITLKIEQEATDVIDRLRSLHLNY